MGRTGAGKSTMGLTLSRIVELSAGTIEIDGVDISKIDINKLRENVTVISQDCALFEGSLRFNIDPENQVTDEQIKELLIKAGLEDLLNIE